MGGNHGSLDQRCWGSDHSRQPSFLCEARKGERSSLPGLWEFLRRKIKAGESATRAVRREFIDQGEELPLLTLQSHATRTVEKVIGFVSSLGVERFTAGAWDDGTSAQKTALRLAFKQIRALAKAKLGKSIIYPHSKSRRYRQCLREAVYARHPGIINMIGMHAAENGRLDEAQRVWEISAAGGDANAHRNFGKLARENGDEKLALEWEKTADNPNDDETRRLLEKHGLFGEISDVDVNREDVILPDAPESGKTPFWISLVAFLAVTGLVRFFFFTKELAGASDYGSEGWGFESLRACHTFSFYFLGSRRPL